MIYQGQNAHIRTFSKSWSFIFLWVSLMFIFSREFLLMTRVWWSLSCTTFPSVGKSYWYILHFFILRKIQKKFLLGVKEVTVTHPLYVWRAPADIWKIFRMVTWQSSISAERLPVPASLRILTGKKALSNKTSVLTKSTNKSIWVVGTTNQLFIKGS